MHPAIVSDNLYIMQALKFMTPRTPLYIANLKAFLPEHLNLNLLFQIIQHCNTIISEF